MKKILSILLILTLLIQGTGVILAEGVADENLTLSPTTRVSANADNCYARVTDDEKNSGDYSLHFYTEGDWLEIAQDYTSALAAGTYTLTWYAKGTGRVWFYSNWGTEFAATHAVDSAVEQSNGWTKYTRTLQIDGNGDTSFLFHGDGAVDQYIDDISLVDANGVDYIVDGGFEEVEVAGGEEPEGPTVDIPDEDLTLSPTTRVSADADNCYARVTDDEKNSGSYSLHFYTEGDWLEIAQDYTSALAAGTYTLTWYAKGTGRVWFYSNWGTEFAATHAVDSAVEQSNGWTKYTRTLQIDGDGDTSFLFHGDGAVDQYIDDISLVDANGVDYIIDGGFEEVEVADSHEHTWDEGVVTQEPTTEAEGVKTYTCSGCGETYTETIEKLPEPEEPSEDIPDEDLVLSGTTHINVENTDAIFAKVTDNEKAGGSYGLHFKSSGDWLEVDQTLLETAVTGGKYIISASVKGVSGRVWFRLGWDDDAWMAVDQSATGTDLGNGWIRVTKEVTIKGNDGDITKLLFHNDGATEAYIDDISVKAVDSDVELVPDGGFEEVTVADGEEPPVDDPDEPTPIPSEQDKYIVDSYLTLLNTNINKNNTNCYARVTDNEKHGENYSLKVYTTGEAIEISQNYTQSLAAGTYTLTFYAKGTGNSYFYSAGTNWGEWVHSSGITPEEQSDGWKKYETSIEIDGSDDSKLLMVIDAAANFYIDDFSLVDENSVDYIKDGGFEDVDVETIKPNKVKDYTVSKPILAQGELTGAGTYTVYTSIKNNKVDAGLPCELLVAVFDQNGVMKLYSSKGNFEATDPEWVGEELSVTFDIAGDGYSIDAYVINNREDVELYQDSKGNKTLSTWVDQVEE